MLNSKKSTLKLLPEINECAAGASSLDHRLQLLDYFVAITGTVWTAAGIYYLTAQQYLVGVACILGIISSLVILAVIRFRPNLRTALANLFLFINVFMLCALSGDASSEASMYFPIIVILAAQLVGSKAAIGWSLCLLAAATFDGIRLFNISGDFMLMQDKFVHNVGTVLTALWLSLEAEKFFNIRTRHLQTLTDSLQEKTRLLELAEETAGVGHWRWDFATDKILLSKEARTICEIDQSVSTGSLDSFVNVWAMSQRDNLFRRLHLAKDHGKDFVKELSFQAEDGIRHVNCRGLCERDDSGNVTGVFGTLRDDTKLRSTTDRLTLKAEQLNKLASFDPLTGLTNRFQFQMQLDHTVEHAIKSGQQMGLLVLDMNGFKEINDTLGHQTGDEVLKVAAARLKECIRDGDVISRLGGDEFTVIMRDASTEDEVETTARRIVESISEPMVVDGHELQAGVSIGASLCPRDSKNGDELFTFADTAMYEAKAQKKGLAIYSPAMTEKLRSRRSTENRLAGAMDRNEFRLVYQPQCDLEAGNIIGFEALLRWKSEGVDVPPLSFIPILESNGKIVEVGQWVLDEACQQIAAWNATGRDLRLAVNISPVQFRDPTFVDRVIRSIRRFQVEPRSLELEITEGFLIQDLENTTKTLFELKSYGFRISVDDFGTGYSSLAYLKHLPIDQLKIDRAFIKDIPDQDEGTIATSIIVLGQSLDMEVLAEGVESESQLDFLRSLCCNSYQGNLLGEAMTAEACEQMLIKTETQSSAIPVVPVTDDVTQVSNNSNSQEI